MTYFFVEKKGGLRSYFLTSGRLKIISVSVEVNFLSYNFRSRKSFANFALSISGWASLLPAPKAQKDLNTVFSSSSDIFRLRLAMKGKIKKRFLPGNTAGLGSLVKASSWWASLCTKYSQDNWNEQQLVKIFVCHEITKVP